MKMKNKLVKLLIVMLTISIFSGLAFALHIGVQPKIMIKMNAKEGSKSTYFTHEVMAKGAGIRYKLVGYTIHREPQYEGNPEALGSANIGYIDGIEVEKIPIKL